MAPRSGDMAALLVNVALPSNDSFLGVIASANEVEGGCFRKPERRRFFMEVFIVDHDIERSLDVREAMLSSLFFVEGCDMMCEGGRLY